MRHLQLLFLLFAFSLSAQNTLEFNKTYIKCVDKWMAFPMNKDSVYTYGFIYIDNSAGLTFNYEGDFKINDKGDFVNTESELTNNQRSIKMRLDLSNNIIAEIPEEKFKDLKIKKYPDWLQTYKENDDDENSLFNRGFIYNAWGECKEALVCLEKLEKSNPKYKGLYTEMAYSYNHLEQFDKAEKILKKAIKYYPNDCYTLKELAYTYKNSLKISESIEVYKKMEKKCDELNYIQETAFNLAHHYFSIKDKENFYKWKGEAKKWSKSKNNYDNYLDRMTTELEK